MARNFFGFLAKNKPVWKNQEYSRRELVNKIYEHLFTKQKTEIWSWASLASRKALLWLGVLIVLL